MNGAMTRGMSSSRMPIPLSVTATTMDPVVAISARLTLTLPPGGVNFNAFDTTLITICRNLVGSV